MSRRKPPGTSTLTRARTLAYARRQKSDDPSDGAVEQAKDSKDVKDAKDVKDVKDAKDAKDIKETRDLKDAKDPEEPHDVAAADEPIEPVRGRVPTLGMAPEDVIGAPPEMPAPAAVAPIAAAPGDVEEPARMPGPRDVPAGNPDDRAPAPGRTPPGDSRSLRRDGEFALIYRQGNAVICRFGTTGTRGQWRVVEYPTTAAASHAYAKECSRFVSEGYSDYRG